MIYRLHHPSLLLKKLPDPSLACRSITPRFIACSPIQRSIYFLIDPSFLSLLPDPSMASAIYRSFEFSLIHRMYYPSLLLLIKDKKCASSISSIKESKYYIQRKTSVDRVILQSFVEQNSCSALMSSSQLIKKCHSYYSISILILKIYHIIVKMFIST